MAEFVRIETPSTEVPGADKVAILRLDRPKVNAFSEQLSVELDEAVTELEGRDDVRGVVVWGGPKIFCAGADIGEFPIGELPRTPDVKSLNDALLKLEALPQVTVSAVNGVALGGGCELSLATDFRLCGESARFGLPEVLLGLFPGGGGTQRLTRIVGPTFTKDMVYTGRNVGAEEALANGLVSAVHPDDELIDKAVEFVARFANAPASLRFAKRAILDGISLPIEEAIAVEQREFYNAFQTDDVVIGIESFLANGPGKADFTGK